MLILEPRSHHTEGRAATVPAEVSPLGAQDWKLAYRIALAILKSPDLAADAAQDTLLRVHDGRHRYSVQHFNPWFRRVAYTCAIRYLRSAWSRHRSPQELATDELASSQHSPEEAASGFILAECVTGCLDDLSDEERMIFAERFVNGEGNSEIARRLEVSTNVAKQRAFRVRRRVRDCVNRSGCATDGGARRARGRNSESDPSQLTMRICKPCMGGVPRFRGPEIATHLELLAGGWQVVKEHHLFKAFDFASQFDADEFVNGIAELAATEGHHPTIHTSNKSIEIECYTHKAGGLTESDFVLAAKIDQLERALQEPSAPCSSTK